MNIKDISTRAGAGIIYILVILLGLLGGRFSFLAVFGAILGSGLFEFYRMVEKDTSHAISKIFNILLGIIIFISVFLYLEGIYTYLLPVCILIYLLILIASAIFLRRHDILHGIIYSVFGQVYITMPLSLLMFISYSPNVAGNEYDWVPVLALFVFLWVNDTAAYFIGSLIGKHKLIEHISPKKSIEGFIAGILFTMLASLIFARLYPGFSVAFWMGLAVVVSLFGTLGDLFESLIKRTCNVKDAGDLIPGHGGILDRIDSLLVAVPAVFLYLILFLSF
ncbi:phosphatidate cytidylyltransferase [Proteiniphilum acetatigenes]|uniref:phosphatidate cytidylyltransferase n=1 Tax=Proteiniphilum acetatigenes TaxID=294710 RepID=UPI00038292B2|nr:phosphatidate cytidylyltransferase [Proteiniphilum acetatigenes]SFK47164.1 phosphatidate cytidylyltransferase [Porphyromonadaceae bacterium KH3CP3RA]